MELNNNYKTQFKRHPLLEKISKMSTMFQLESSSKIKVWWSVSEGFPTYMGVVKNSITFDRRLNIYVLLCSYWPRIVNFGFELSKR